MAFLFPEVQKLQGFAWQLISTTQCRVNAFLSTLSYAVCVSYHIREMQENELKNWSSSSSFVLYLFSYVRAVVCSLKTANDSRDIHLKYWDALMGLACHKEVEHNVFDVESAWVHTLTHTHTYLLFVAPHIYVHGYVLVVPQLYKLGVQVGACSTPVLPQMDVQYMKS